MSIRAALDSLDLWGQSLLEISARARQNSIKHSARFSARGIVGFLSRLRSFGTPTYVSSGLYQQGLPAVSNVEAKVDYIAVCDNVFFALQTHFALLSGLSRGLAGDIVLIGYYLRPDKAPLDV